MTTSRRAGAIAATLLAMVVHSAAIACEGDTFVGGGGDDEITGSDCDDVIVGNDGDNELTGGDGADAFVFSTGFCTPNRCFLPVAPFFPTFGVSTITDFSPGEDRIVLDKATFVALQSDVGPGFSAAEDFAVVASDADVASETALIVYSLESATIFYNENGAADGLGEGGPFAALDDMPDLGPLDFEIIRYAVTVTTTTTTTTVTSTSTPGRRTTSTTTRLPVTTSTTVPACASADCVLGGALQTGPCAGAWIPPRLTQLTNRATSLVAKANTASGSKHGRLVKRAGKVLAALAGAAEHDLHARRPKIASACASAIADAARQVANGLDRP